MRFIIFLALTLIISCTTTSRFRPFSQDLKCSEQLHSILEAEAHKPPLLTYAKWASGNLMSYLWTGTNYTLEFLWDVTSGTLIFVALCAPVAAARSASSASFPQSNCLPVKSSIVRRAYQTLSAPPLGQRAFKNTKHWRCPDLSQLSRNLSRAFTCSDPVMDTTERHRLRVSARAIKNSPFIFSCLSPELQNKLSSLIHE